MYKVHPNIYDIHNLKINYQMTGFSHECSPYSPQLSEILQCQRTLFAQILFHHQELEFYKPWPKTSYRIRYAMDNSVSTRFANSRKIACRY